MNWFTPLLIVSSLFIALVCPFLLWMIQERCLVRSHRDQDQLSTTVITKPHLLIIRSDSTVHSPYQSPESVKTSEEGQGFFTPLSSTVTEQV